MPLGADAASDRPAASELIGFNVVSACSAHGGFDSGPVESVITREFIQGVVDARFHPFESAYIEMGFRQFQQRRYRVMFLAYSILDVLFGLIRYPGKNQMPAEQTFR